LVDRLFEGFDLSVGPARYSRLMSPALPDGDGVLTRLGIRPARSRLADDQGGVAEDPGRDRRRSSVPAWAGPVESLEPFDLKF
jgi:hypothetical protein